MAEGRKKKKESEIDPNGWMTTYGDMVTLLLCFFVILLNPPAVQGYKMELVVASMSGLGPLKGGMTLDAGPLATLGNSVNSLVSKKQASHIKISRKQVQQNRNNMLRDIQGEGVTVKFLQRGIIISLAADTFFQPTSAQVNMNRARQSLENIATALRSSDLANRSFRVEGYSDNTPIDPSGPYPSNWELSTARSTNILHILVDYGVDPKNFEIVGYGENRPIASNDTPEGRAQNRRVDIVILSQHSEETDT